MRTMTRRIHQAVCKYSIISNNAVYQKLLPPEKENVEKIEMSFYCRRSNWIVYVHANTSHYHKHPLEENCSKEKCRLIEKETSLTVCIQSTNCSQIYRFYYIKENFMLQWYRSYYQRRNWGGVSRGRAPPQLFNGPAQQQNAERPQTTRSDEINIGDGASLLASALLPVPRTRSRSAFSHSEAERTADRRRS